MSQRPTDHTTGLAFIQAIQRTSHALAMLALQSERYRTDPDYRDAVDNVLAWTKGGEPPHPTGSVWYPPERLTDPRPATPWILALTESELEELHELVEGKVDSPVALKIESLWIDMTVGELNHQLAKGQVKLKDILERGD